MDYARFVRLRRPLWEAFARGLEAARREPRRLTYGGLEDLAMGYRQVLHDHALAAARYPETGAARRLSALALAGTHRLTRQQPAKGGLLFFLGRTFPRAFRRQLDLLGICLGLFLLAALLGLILADLRPELASAFLGPKAVRDLAEGRLWTNSLATSVPPAVSSSRIATNNLGVALLAWSGGLLAGLLPLYVVLVNGFLLGALVAVTMHYSLAGELLTFVAAHGPLEITLILVSAASGLGLGRALVEAGDRPRAEALRDAGGNALAVLLGCLPWFVLLGAVEVFVSPSPAVPVEVKIGLGCGLEALFLGLALRPAGARAGARGETDE
jgi:uncharacterized membrane protein SpoIIM required for sporulation